MTRHDSDPPQVEVRDANLRVVAPVVGAWQLEATLRLNYLSSWVLTIPNTAANLRAITALQADTDRPGVVVTHNGTVVLSGDVEQFERVVEVTESGARDVWVFQGDDDMARLRVLAWPAPNAPLSGQDAVDRRTGRAEDVIRAFVSANVGPAASPGRQVPHLTIAPSQGRGLSSTWGARWEPLLDVLRRPAFAADLGFRVVNVDEALRFEVYDPTDRSATVRFSTGLGNLSNFTYSRKRRDVSHVITRGGEGAARVHRMRSVATSRRREEFIDNESSTDTAELDQAADELLKENEPASSLSLTVIDTPRTRFAVDYFLGDRVAVEIDEVRFVDVVREVTLAYSGEGGTEIAPLIGPEGSLDPRTDDALTRRVDRIAREVAALQARRA